MTHRHFSLPAETLCAVGVGSERITHRGALSREQSSMTWPRCSSVTLTGCCEGSAVKDSVVKTDSFCAFLFFVSTSLWSSVSAGEVVLRSSQWCRPLVQNTFVLMRSSWQWGVCPEGKLRCCLRPLAAELSIELHDAEYKYHQVQLPKVCYHV